MIEVRNLSYLYPSGRGLKDLSLRVPAGESCSVIGPSGCGKTTLIHIIAGLIEIPDDGASIAPGQAGRIGLVQQKDALFPWLTAGENVALGLSGSGKEEVPALLEQLGVPHVIDSYPGRLSGGERRRVAIARTLIGEPEVLLLDEPSAALDAFSREALQDLLLELQQQRKTTAVYITHNIEEALFLGKTVAVMGDGTIIELRENPLYPDRDARLHRNFYREAVNLRQVLGRVTG